MKNRKIEFILFFLGGGGLFCLLFLIHDNWLDIAAWLMGRHNIVFDQQTTWIRNLNKVVTALPWIVGIILLSFAVLKRRWVPFVAFAASQIAGFAIVILMLFGPPAIEEYEARMPFESTAWKAENTERPSGIRVHMVEHLLQTYKLVGMSKTEINDLLGKPTPTSYFGEYDYVYWLGPERGMMSIDSEWLALKYNDDIVVSVEVLTD